MQTSTEVAKHVVETHLAAIQSLVNWSEQIEYEDSFLTLAREDTKLAIAFFKDLLL